MKRFTMLLLLLVFTLTEVKSYVIELGEAEAASSRRSRNRRSARKSHARSTPRPRSEIQCLANALCGEARGEKAPGQIAVGQVILRRIALGYNGATSICNAVYSKRQFAPRHCSGKLGADMHASAKEALRRGPGKADHFHSYGRQRTKQASFSINCKPLPKVGGHWMFQCMKGDINSTVAQNRMQHLEEILGMEVMVASAPQTPRAEDEGRAVF